MKLLWASFKDCVLGSLGRGREVGGHRASSSPVLFLDGTQTCRAQAQSRDQAAEELRSWEKKRGPSSGRRSQARVEHSCVQLLRDFKQEAAARLQSAAS